jgi:very-short-patch-repair endonuclease
MGIIKQTVRELRKNQTQSENAFWNLIRGKKFLGLRFQRQFPIKYTFDKVTSFFVADFYCHKLRLIIEIDGSIHDKSKERDKFRDLIIKQYGFNILRISDKDILCSSQDVLDKIKTCIT